MTYGCSTRLVHGEVLKCVEGVFSSFAVGRSGGILKGGEEGFVFEDEVMTVFGVPGEVG